MKYLIYCGPGIGDFIMILPMARMIKKNDPTAYISIITKSDKKRVGISNELLKLQYDINDLEYYSMHEYCHLIKFVRYVGFQKYDFGFVLQYTDTPKTSVWPYRIVKFAAKITCGIELKNKPSIKYDYGLVRTQNLKIINYTEIMLKNIGMYKKVDVNNEKLLRLEHIKSEHHQFKLLNDKLVCLVLGAADVSGDIKGIRISNGVKKWSYENWFALGRKFVKNGYKVVLLGGRKEKDEIKDLTESSALDGMINLAGINDITQSMAVILQSEIVIGADTGLMHCAGALKIPSLTLFGCTYPNEYLAYGNKSYWISAREICSPCFGSEKALLCETYSCMKHISVESVFEKANNILVLNKGNIDNENQFD